MTKEKLDIEQIKKAIKILDQKDPYEMQQLICPKCHVIINFPMPIKIKRPKKGMFRLP